MNEGPNVKKLIAYHAGYLAVPAGGGLGDVVRLIGRPGALAAVVKDATYVVERALAVVKSAPDNPFGDDDEAIAAELLRRIEERRRSRK